jgi:CBS domain-containing protein
LDPAGQHAARTLFLRLIKIGDGTEDTRRRVARADLLRGLDPSSVLPVVDGGELVGLVSIGDVVKARIEEMELNGFA